MNLADEIKYKLMPWCRSHLYDVVLPNFYFGTHEMDVLKISQTNYITEYEIKTSRADYLQDFKKGNKHLTLKTGKRICNRFFFVVPQDLIAVHEVPTYCGLIYYKMSFRIVKNAPLLHRTQPAANPYFYQELSRKLAAREHVLSSKVRRHEYSASKLKGHIRTLLKLKDSKADVPFNQQLIDLE